MNRRRLVAAIFFSAVILAVLGLIVFTEAVNSSQTVTVLRLRTDVQRGAQFSGGDVDQVPFRADPNELNYQRPGDVSRGSRYTLSLHNGDILRPDDLESPDARVALTIAVSNPPPLNPGDSVDVFAAIGSAQVLVGHGLPLLSTASTNLTVLVPTRDEFAWVSLAAASATTPLHVVRATTDPPAGVPPSNAAGAICTLAGQQCSAAGGPGAGIPSPTAKP